MPHGANSSSRSFRARACENCRLRKIKCDKAIPCSSCGTLGVTCHAASSRLTERPPVPPSNHERNLGLIEDRLSAVEKSIHELSHRSAATASVASLGHHSPSLSSQSSLEIATAAFEGQSSFGSATLLAKKVADLSVARVPGSKLDENVYRALLSLNSSLDKHHPAPRSSETTEVASPATSNLNLPPVAFVISLIKRIKEQPPFFLVHNSWRDYLQIEKLCQKIYFPSEPITAGSITLLHGLLYFIIRDYIHIGDTSLPQPDCAIYADMCEKNFVQGLKSYDIFVSPTLEKVQALLIGVIKCQEETNLPLCWTYLSVAFDMCQSMGYHSNSELKSDPFPVSEEKRHIFWRLYMVDKNLSLNLGRTSHFQDHDIDCGIFMPSTDPHQHPWDLMTHVIIKFSAIQGRVYDKLYSVSASRSPPEEKMRVMEQLSTELIEVRNELLEIDVSGGYYAESLQGIAACAEFITYSVLTVIYRAQMSPNAMAISSKCLEAAKLGLQSHLKCFPYFRERKSHKKAEYVTWILLYPSFTPFVILFTHAIATGDLEELALLQETVGSLELVKDLSRGSQHLYEICKAFLTIADALINSQRTLNGLEHHADGSLVLPFMADGQTQITFPDISWTEDMYDFNMDSADISGFLNDFLGTNRPGTDILRLNFK
ncbi:C6 transcription factor [Histoplasma capsulatum var. duboisii H88]|uniref:C6 transcription factor n=1 Tax=Ajellomyces capsulatus (strain H88) TaxID=544711 RepID=A0A8A1LBQ6_AJEC8|nr:C6 transcription factor [Histoplasma capsulatum var. duboisii H88]